MAEKRHHYTPEQREAAREMYVHRGIINYGELAHETGIVEGTLRRWSAEDKWRADIRENFSGMMGRIQEGITKGLERLTQHYLDSFGEQTDGSLSLPSENLELRINRMTHSLSRVHTFRGLMPVKQRIDIINEIQRYGYECVEDKSLTQEELLTAFKLLTYYTGSLDINRDID